MLLRNAPLAKPMMLNELPLALISVGNSSEGYVKEVHTGIQVSDQSQRDGGKGDLLHVAPKLAPQRNCKAATTMAYFFVSAGLKTM